MKIIDVDSHSNPRSKDVAIEKEYMHLGPVYYVDGKGTRRTILNNKLIQIFHNEDKGITYTKRELNGRAAHRDASVRFQEVTEAGIDFQFISVGSTDLFAYLEADAGAALCRSYNDFLYKTFIKPYPKTFGGLPLLPLQDVKLAFKELERCVKEFGMMALLMPTNWNGIDMADHHWWNLYDRALELGIRTVFVHVSAVFPDCQWVGKERFAVLGPDGTRGRRIVSTPFENCANVVNLIFGGMLDNFPDLRIAFLEGGTDFIIGLKNRIHETLVDLPYLRNNLTQPIERYFDHLYFLVDSYLLKKSEKWLQCVVEEMGADQLLFGSDYPHESDSLDTCSLIKNLTCVSGEAKDKILGGNASILFAGKL